MTKVMIGHRSLANVKMFEDAGLEIVEDPSVADFIMSGATVPKFARDKLHKVIMFQGEAPLTDHRKWCYNNFDKFHTVFCYNPKGDNQFPISDNPIFFPFTPGKKLDIKRKSTKMTKRGIFYAGGNTRGVWTNVKDTHGEIILKETRDEIGRRLINKYTDSTIVGYGWHENTKDVITNWRVQKLEDIEKSGSDFHLCMDNCMYSNYVTEKIHDGFISDRVVLYLGEPNIEELIPKDCFINLNPLFNKETKEFDFDKLIEIITTMTQEEYDKIINNARKWRASFEEKEYYDRYAQLNQFMIDRIKGIK